MGMNRELRVGKILLSMISSSEFNSTTINSKFSKVVSYIEDKNIVRYVMLS